MDFEQLQEQIASKLTCDQILDIIGFTTYELVEALSSEIEEFRTEFERQVDD